MDLAADLTGLQRCPDAAAGAASDSCKAANMPPFQAAVNGAGEKMGGVDQHHKKKHTQTKREWKKTEYSCKV